MVKFLLVRQVNKANGKLRAGAVAPRHDRIIQLGIRDGSLAKREQLHSAELAATSAKIAEITAEGGKAQPPASAAATPKKEKESRQQPSAAPSRPAKRARRGH